MDLKRLSSKIEDLETEIKDLRDDIELLIQHLEDTNELLSRQK